MSETSDPIDSVDFDLSSHQGGPIESQSGNNLIALDGSLPSIHSVSLILQALLPLLISLVLLLAGRRLYRFTTTVSVALSSALFTWALFVNLETGQSIGRWTGEAAAVTVWSVMIGGSLIGALIGYQFTWWGAHVTGRLCLGANSGVGLAFSVLLIKNGLLIQSPAGQWSLVGASVAVGIFLVLWDHVMGPLVAITSCGSFLFLIGADMFNTLGLDGVGAGLRLLLDQNPDHSTYINSYAPPKSTVILIIVSWVIGFISFAFQYACYSVPFGPLSPSEDVDEEKGLDSESKTKESISEAEIKNSHSSNQKFSHSEAESAGTEPSQPAGNNTDRGSNETSDGTKTSATLIDSNGTSTQSPPEPSMLPYLSSRPASGPSGECGSPAALALSPSVYSRYRRTQDPIHKPPSRTPIQYQFHSNLVSFTNPRRVETVDEVTESSASVRGVEHTARSSVLTIGGTSDAIGRTNSMSEEYINAMMHLAASEDCNIADNGQPEIVGTKSVGNPDNNHAPERVGQMNPDDDTQQRISENSNAPEPCDQKKSLVAISVQQSETKAHIDPNASSPLASNVASPPTKARTSPLSNTAFSEVSPLVQLNQPSAQKDGSHSNNELARPPNPLPNVPHSTGGQEIRTSYHAVHSSSESEDTSTKAGSSGVSSQAQPRYDHSPPALLHQRSQELAPVSQTGRIRNAYSDRDPESSTINEDVATRSTRDNLSVVDAVDRRRYSHRPLPQRPTSYDRSTTSEIASKSGKVTDGRSLKSANSNGSSMLDSFYRVVPDSSVPTTPSSAGKALKEEQKQVDLVSVSTRKRLSIVTGKQAQLPRTTSTRTQNSQEAQIIDFPEPSPGATSINSAVPHTPTLGNMLLRVSEGAEKLRKQSDITDTRTQAENYHVSSGSYSRGEEGDDGDAATLRSDPSRRSTICMSSIYAGHTSAEEGGKSCSESEDGDDRSREQYFDPRRAQQLNKALGEWSNLFSDELTTEDRAEASHTNCRRSAERSSPSLHSIPLPSRQNKARSSQESPVDGSMYPTPICPTPFVGKPLAEVPWPQMRPDKRKESNTTNGMETQQKRWTTASSIFPPLGYESSMESPPPPQLLRTQDGETGSHPSDTGPDLERTTRRISTGTLTSFEGAVGQNKQPGMFCSASSHIADDNDLSDIGTSRIDDTTDDDHNYESAADYSKSFRPSASGSFSAADHSYLSADDGDSQIDF